MRPSSILLSLVFAASHLHAADVPTGVAEKIAAALPDKPYAKPAKPRKLLIFSVTNGFHHSSIATGQLAFTELGKKTGAYETVVSDDLANFEVDALKQFDAVCFLSTTGEVFSPSNDAKKSMTADQIKEAETKADQLKANLMAFIKSGKGFVGIHSATDCCYEWPEYGQMINGYFDGHPWTSGTDVSIKVEPGQEKNPLVAMFDGKNVDFKEEIYQLKDPYDSKKVDMLLRLDPDKTKTDVPGVKRADKDFGVAWARNWGKGRMFYCSLGHNDEIYENPTVLRHYLAGLQWAIGDFKVDVKH
jgi:uncharacterized protein